LQLETVGKLDIYILADDYVNRRGYLGQHGASYLIRITKDHEIVNILFDTGTYSEPILFNMKTLKIDPNGIDIIMLSHRHYDHTGGLVEILKAIGKSEVPIIAHPDIFKVNLAFSPHLISIGLPHGVTRESVEEIGGVWILSKDPVTLFPGVVTTGEVSRVTTFEDDAVRGFYTIENGRIKPDKMFDDVSLIINTKEGLVIIVGCAHAGIVNIIKHSIALTGINKIRAVIGATHLVTASSDRLNKTIAEFKTPGLENLYLGHCTGLKAVSRLMHEFDEKFEPLHCGMKISF